jgi:hypothetical protein
VVPNPDEEIEGAEDKAYHTENTPCYRIRKEEQLADGNDDEHQAHGDVHPGGVDAAKLRVLFPSVSKAVVYSEDQADKNQGAEHRLNDKHWLKHFLRELEYKRALRKRNSNSTHNAEKKQSCPCES